jgi:hypothetical protein
MLKRFFLLTLVLGGLVPGRISAQKNQYTFEKAYPVYHILNEAYEQSKTSVALLSQIDAFQKVMLAESRDSASANRKAAYDLLFLSENIRAHMLQELGQGDMAFKSANTALAMFDKAKAGAPHKIIYKGNSFDIPVDMLYRSYSELMVLLSRQYIARRQPGKALELSAKIIENPYVPIPDMAFAYNTQLDNAFRKKDTAEMHKILTKATAFYIYPGARQKEKLREVLSEYSILTTAILTQYPSIRADGNLTSKVFQLIKDDIGCREAIPFGLAAVQDDYKSTYLIELSDCARSLDTSRGAWYILPAETGKTYVDYAKTSAFSGKENNREAFFGYNILLKNYWRKSDTAELHKTLGWAGAYYSKASGANPFIADFIKYAETFFDAYPDWRTPQLSSYLFLGLNRTLGCQKAASYARDALQTGYSGFRENNYVDVAAECFSKNTAAMSSTGVTQAMLDSSNLNLGHEQIRDSDMATAVAGYNRLVMHYVHKKDTLHLHQELKKAAAFYVNAKTAPEGQPFGLFASYADGIYKAYPNFGNDIKMDEDMFEAVYKYKKGQDSCTLSAIYGKAALDRNVYGDYLYNYLSCLATDKAALANVQKLMKKNKKLHKKESAYWRIMSKLYAEQGEAGKARKALKKSNKYKKAGR